MLKKTITFNDYNGLERKEDFYFNLTKAEAIEMELSTSGSLSEMIKRIIDTQDVPEIIKIFKDLIMRSYGEKSLDGKYFIKIDENGNRLADRFAQTEAYSELYMELVSNPKSAADFVNGVIPSINEVDKN